MLTYLSEMYHGLKSVFIGMKITARYMFKKPVTLEYPEQRWVAPEGYRGFHEFEIDRCIGCYICAKACPVSCIYIDVERVKEKGKNVIVKRFAIDYNKCMFCNLCCEPCPVECIWMGPTFDMSSWDKSDMVVDFVQVGKTVPQNLGHAFARHDGANADDGYYRDMSKTNTEFRPFFTMGVPWDHAHDATVEASAQLFGGNFVKPAPTAPAAVPPKPAAPAGAAPALSAPVAPKPPAPPAP